MKTFHPRPYQRQIIQHILDKPRCAIWADVGLGKTAPTLVALQELKRAGHDVYPALVVAPARVALSVWPAEARKWDVLQNTAVRPVIGTPKQRLEALSKGVQIFTINYENIPWLVQLFGEKWPFKACIADESSRLKGFRTRQGAKQAKALGAVAFLSDRFVELTGTPAANGIKDLWGQLWFLDKGERLGKTFSRFKDRWFKEGWRGFTIEPLPGAQEEIQELVKDLCLSIRAEDWLTTEKPIHVPVEVALPKAAQVLYWTMEREMFVEIEKRGVTAVNAAVLTSKCLQIAAGALYLDDANRMWKSVHDEKIEAVRSIYEENGCAPLLVAYQFNFDLERLQKAFPQGEVLDRRPSTIDRWNAGEIPLLFAHPKSCGHGLNLQDGSNRLCFMNHDWNLDQYLQMIGRIGPARQKASGHNRTVFVYNIIAKNTIEELVMRRLKTKESVQELLLNAVKRRGAP
jgi:SNF2 family DNA or RNA helicase